MTTGTHDRSAERAAATATATSSGPLISNWSAVSAFGIGRESFSAGVRNRRPVVTELDPDTWPAPTARACLVPGGGPRELLGRKGTRSMDRATGLAVTAVGLLLDDGAGGRTPGVDEGTALVLGTSNGSVRSIMSFTRDALTEDKPYHVDPARFPNTVMNCAAGQSAIRHGLRGPNATIAGGRASALLALNHAQRLQRSGHARSVVCGAVEEFSAERAWLDFHAHAGREEETLPTGEGSAVLLLEPPAPQAGGPRDGGPGRGGPPAELAAVEVGLPQGESDIAAVLAEQVRRALDRAGLGAEGVWAVAPAGLPGTLGAAERRALETALDGRAPRTLLCGELLGDTGAVSAAFQITALLGAAGSDPESAGRAGLVTSVDRDGVVGCALLRFPGRHA